MGRGSRGCVRPGKAGDPSEAQCVYTVSIVPGQRGCQASVYRPVCTQCVYTVCVHTGHCPRPV